MKRARRVAILEFLRPHWAAIEDKLLDDCRNSKELNVRKDLVTQILWRSECSLYRDSY